MQLKKKVSVKEFKTICRFLGIEKSNTIDSINTIVLLKNV